MMRLSTGICCCMCLAAVFSLILGCATPKATYDLDRKQSFACSGRMHHLNLCRQKAHEICGGDSYVILVWMHSSRESILRKSLDNWDNYGGRSNIPGFRGCYGSEWAECHYGVSRRISTRSMVVKCIEAPEVR